MSESSDIDDIRQKKIEDLKANAAAPETPGEPVAVNGEDELAQFVQDHDVVVVDFFATWCGPCKMMEPVMEELAADDRIAVAEVDIDQNQRLAQQRGVRGVPTFYVYADGEVVEQFVGARDKSAFLDVVERYA